MRFFRPRTLLSAIAACALATGSVTPALAGPDDGKIVATQAHVDSPKTFWRDGKFVLMNENPVKTVPIEKTVNWVGKGYDGYTGTHNQYQFTLPDSPSLAFMGSPGDTWYSAPATPEGNTNPTWTGFGADTNIPLEQFRDRAFFLDLLHVNGPGRVELFNYPKFDYPDDFTHLLSSSDPAYRSTMLTAGTHTHNTTAFSRPGRYELTYRVAARGTHGELIASEPRTQVWQVGGMKPSKTTTPSTQDRYNAAPTGDLNQAGYELTLAPKAKKTKDGDQHLSTVSFHGRDTKLTGTLTLFVNGYFLTDLEVKNGRASWDEMFGSAASQIQAVFTPVKGQDAPRWVSPPLNYREGAKAATTSAKGEGQWPAQIPDPANTTQPTDLYTPSSNAYTITVEPDKQHKNFARITLEFADKKMRGEISGGMFTKPTDSGPAEGFDAGLAGGSAVLHPAYDSWNKDATIRVTFTPHATMNAHGFTVDLPKRFNPGLHLVHKGTFRVDAGGDPTPTATMTPPAMCPVEGKRLVLGDGHVDIRTRVVDDTLSVDLMDDTGIGSRESTARELDTVAYAVHDHDRRDRQKALLDPALDVLGKEGDTFYALPQVQMKGTLWPGYSTLGVDYTKLAGPVTLHLDPVTVPAGAQYAAFTQQLNRFNVLLDSSTKDTAIDIDFATHAHATWAFTKPGTYVLDTYSTGKTKAGKKLTSTHHKLVVLVGDKATQCDEVPGSAGASTTPVTPEPTHGGGAAGNTDRNNTDHSKASASVSHLPRTGIQMAFSLAIAAVLIGVGATGILVTLRRHRNQR